MKDKLDSPTIMITGVSGFVGKHLSLYYIKKGFKVIGVTRSAHNSLQIPSNQGFQIYKCDITNSDNIEKVRKKLSDKNIKTLFHLAAELHSNEKEKLFKCNTEGTVTVLNFCLELGVQRLIFASTTMVTGPVQKKKIPADEEHPCFPVSYYGKSKLKAEHILLDQNSIPVTILRFGYIYGPNYPSILEPLFANNEEGVCDFLYRYQPYKHEGRRQSLQFIYIDDVVRSLVKASMNPEINGIFNIVGDEYLSRKEIVKRFYAIQNQPTTGWKVSLKCKLMFIMKRAYCFIRSPYDCRRIHWAYSNSKASTQLYFKPEVSFEDGLRNIIGSMS
jgi:UDP-glucose 4-epimerase